MTSLAGGPGSTPGRAGPGLLTEDRGPEARWAREGLAVGPPRPNTSKHLTSAQYILLGED